MKAFLQKLTLRTRITLALVVIFSMVSAFQILRFWFFIKDDKTVYLIENRNLQTENAASSLSQILLSLGQSIAADPLNEVSDALQLADSERLPEADEVFLESLKSRRKLLLARSKDGELRAKSIDMAWLFKQVPAFGEIRGVLLSQNATPIAFFGMNETAARNGAVERFKQLLSEGTVRGETVRKQVLLSDLIMGHQIVEGTNLLLYTEANLSELLETAFKSLQTEVLGNALALIAMIIVIGFIFQALTIPLQKLVDVFELIGAGVRQPSWPALLPEFAPIQQAVGRMNDAISERQREIELIGLALGDILRLSQTSARSAGATEPQREDLLSLVIFPVSQFLAKYFGRLCALEGIFIVKKLRTKSKEIVSAHHLSLNQGLKSLTSNASEELYHQVLEFEAQGMQNYKDSDELFVTNAASEKFCLRLGQTTWGRRLTIIFHTELAKLSSLERRILETFANALNKMFEDKYLEELHLEMSLAQSELASARDIQRASLVEPDANQDNRVQVHTFYQPCEQVGGDWYGVFYHPQINRLNVYLGDVSGHGLSSAFLANLVSGAVQAAEMSLRNNTQGQLIGQRFTALASQLNALVASGSGQKKNMTMCMASLQLETGTLTVLSAGQPAPLRLEANGAKAGMLAVKQNNFLGCSWVDTFETSTFQLQPGESLLFYTDGLTESRTRPQKDSHQEAQPKLGSKNLIKLALELGPAQNLATSLAEHVARNRFVDDDLALVVVKWQQGAAQKKRFWRAP